MPSNRRLQSPPGLFWVFIMLRRSARSAGISLRNEDADHGVEPETEVEARGHVGRRDVEEAGAEEGTAGEGDRKEPSNWDENEGLLRIIRVI